MSGSLDTVSNPPKNPIDIRVIEEVIVRELTSLEISPVFSKTRNSTTITGRKDGQTVITYSVRRNGIRGPAPCSNGETIAGIAIGSIASRLALEDLHYNPEKRRYC